MLPHSLKSTEIAAAGAPPQTTLGELEPAAIQTLMLYAVRNEIKWGMNVYWVAAAAWLCPSTGNNIISFAIIIINFLFLNNRTVFKKLGFIIAQNASFLTKIIGGWYAAPDPLGNLQIQTPSCDVLWTRFDDTLPGFSQHPYPGPKLWMKDWS